MFSAVSAWEISPSNQQTKTSTAASAPTRRRRPSKSAQRRKTVSSAAEPTGGAELAPRRREGFEFVTSEPYILCSIPLRGNNMRQFENI